MTEKIKRLFLCRHGETEANIRKIYCGGNRESPLTNNGKLQAALLGKALKNYYEFRGKLIIASSKERAKETAKIISHHLNPRPATIILEGLSEIDIGGWCGKTSEEIEKLFPEKYKEWASGFTGLDFVFPGGGSIKESRERILKCFNVIKTIWLNNKDENNNDIIVVAHGGTNMIILSEILKLEMTTCDIRTITQNNTCVNIINYCKNGAWRSKIQVALINSTHHLDMKF